MVVTDGDDNYSATTLEELVKSSQQAGVLIYSIGLLAEEEPRAARQAKRALETLAEATGASAFFAKDATEVDRLAHQVAQDIRNQYIVQYTPANQTMDGKFRNIKIAVKGPGGLTVRTRPGYWATHVGRSAAPGPRADGRRPRCYSAIVGSNLKLLLRLYVRPAAAMSDILDRGSLPFAGLAVVCVSLLFTWSRALRLPFSFYTPLLMLAVVYVPGVLVLSSLLGRLGSLRVVFQRDYAPLLTCTAMAWAAAFLPLAVLAGLVPLIRWSCFSSGPAVRTSRR